MILINLNESYVLPKASGTYLECLEQNHIRKIENSKLAIFVMSRRCN